jgi:site-specific DNA recombinase
MKAAAYVRYSSDNQREESIDAQIRAIQEYASKNDIEIVKIYPDEAKSATTDQRPYFLQMMKDSELGIFQAVVVHKLDRFSRDRYDSAFYKRQLKKNGVRLISVLEQLDDSPESIILESVLEGMAEYYSRNLAREVMKGMKETALQCKHVGGIPPLGYDVGPDKTYIINEHEALIVKLIFEMFAAGYSYNQIIDKLNSEGYRTKTNKPFGKNSIHDILRNEKYCGIYIFNKSTSKENGKRNNHKSKSEDEIIKVNGGMPQIIDRKVWEAVRERMDKNKKGPAANKAKEVYLLSGLIYCGKCGGAMVGNRRYSGRNKTKYLSYECSTRKRKKECDMKAVGAEYVESIVIDELAKSIFAPDAIEQLAQKIYQFANSQSSTIHDDIKTLKKELTDIQSQIDNIVDAVANGLFHSSFKEKMDTLEAQKETISRRLNEAELQAQINSPTVDMIKAYIAKDSDIKNKSPKELQRIIQTYIKKVTVYDDYIDIEFIVDLSGGGEPYQFKSTISLQKYRHQA